MKRVAPIPIEAIEAAAERLSGTIVRTPLVRELIDAALVSSPQAIAAAIKLTVILEGGMPEPLQP